MAGTFADLDFDSSQYWDDPELSDSEVLGEARISAKTTNWLIWQSLQNQTGSLEGFLT